MEPDVRYARSGGLLANEADRLWFANWLRVGATPQVAYALNRAWIESDVSDVLPAVRVPTFVLYRPSFYEPFSLETASSIPGARAPRVSGTDPWGIFLSPEIPDEIERFVAGETGPDVPDTVLATLLFTDIVGSTARSAELGDRGWRELLERHHALVRRAPSRTSSRAPGSRSTTAARTSSRACPENGGSTRWTRRRLDAWPTR